MSEQLNVGVFGVNGRMGRVLATAVNDDSETQLAAAMVRQHSSLTGIDVGELAGFGKSGLSVVEEFSESTLATSVMIDFTLPEALEGHINWCRQHNKNLVIGTTAVGDDIEKLIADAASDIAIVHAPNMSVGVNLLFNLVQTAARVMGDYTDIEILEAHHRYKKDAPSGTAVKIGEIIAETLAIDLKDHAIYGRSGINEERDRKTIGFATVRAGDIVGEHTTLFADIGERLEITHKATDRMTFAKGAVRAAKWLSDKQSGLFTMQDVLGLS